MRPVRLLLLALTFSACTEGTDPKSGETDTLETDTLDTETVDTDTLKTDTLDTDTDTDTVDTDTVDTDSSDTDDTALDTSPIDTFQPMGTGDTSVDPPDTSDSASIGGGTGDPDDTSVDPDDTSVDPGDTGGGGPPQETGGSDTDLCRPGFIPDCNDECYPEALKGDGTCHIGGFSTPDFDCEIHDFDDGDCSTGETGGPDECPDQLDVRDCNGRCYTIAWVGDGQCDNGPPGANFNCQLFAEDGGDCVGVIDTDPADTSPVVDTAAPDSGGDDTGDSGDSGDTDLIVLPDTADTDTDAP